MSLFALGLLFVAAIFHAGWNFLVKRAREKQVFTWWALVIGSVCFAPLLIVDSPFSPRLWPYMLCSAAVEAIYYVILTRAYDHGDFSLVYPVARGTAPALLVVWAMLFLGDRPRPAGFVGIALIIGGLALVGGKSWWQLRKTTSVTTSAVALALSVALCISVYSTIDGGAVRLVSPLSYTVAVIGISTVFLTPMILLRYGHHVAAAEWRVNWGILILAGIFMLLSYMLVLQTYAISHVSYAGAIREMSILFAAFMGWRWLGEDFGLWRIFGAAFIFAGILVIAVAG